MLGIPMMNSDHLISLADKDKCVDQFLLQCILHVDHMDSVRTLMRVVHDIQNRHLQYILHDSNTLHDFQLHNNLH